MKNLLLILLLANILYFLWGMFAPDDPEPGVEIVNEANLGPPLSVAQEPSPEIIESVGAVLGSGESEDLAAVVGLSCVTIGPLRDSNDADEAQTRYAAAGMRAGVRSTQGQVFIGHWVQIRNVPSRDEANRILRELEQGGLPDAYPDESEEEGRWISLGLFGNRDSAEKIELQARSLGFNAEMVPTTRDGTIYFVDIALPPGKGAGDIVDRYGEDQVALRDAATCPASS